MKTLKKILIRQEFPGRSLNFFLENRIWIIVGLSIFLLALFYRSWENFTHPGLYMEDPAYFSGYYGGYQPFMAVFNTSRGYVNLIINVYAWIVAKVDVRIQPGLYLIFAILTGITTAVNLIFSGLFKSRPILLIAPLVLGLTGMNHVFYYMTLIYQFYTTTLLLLCLLFFPLPRTKSGLVGMAALFTILPWSGPYSVLAIPVGILLLLFFRDRWKSFMIILMISSTLLYYTTVKGGTTMFGNIFNRWVLSYYYHVLFKDIFFLGLLGEPTIVKSGIFLVCLAALFYLQRNDPAYIKLSFTMLVLIVAALAPYFLSKKIYHLHLDACYLLISYFFWLVFLLYSLDIFFLRSSLKQIPALFAFFFLVFVAFDNYPLERKRIPIQEKMPAFLRTVYHYEKLALEKKNRFIKLQYKEFYFKPTALVGSRQMDAVQVGADFFKIPYGRQFIVHPAVSPERKSLNE